MASRMCIALSLLASLAAGVWAVPVTVPTPPTGDQSLAAAHNTTVMSSVCMSMVPDHSNNGPQATPAPYVISLSENHAAPGDTVHVHISGLNGEQFRGVYIQGRHGEAPVGQFLPPGESSPPVTIRDCPPGHQNAVSYISRKPVGQLTLDYVIPDVPEITFRATFVRTFSDFWVGVTSERLFVTKPVPL